MVQSTFRRFALLLILSAVVTFPGSRARGQSNELVVTIGGYFPVNDPVSASAAFAVGGSFAHRVASIPFAAAYVEVPVFATFNSTASAFQLISGRPRYSVLFVTPGIKLKIAPEFPLSPWVLVGGGVAHFSTHVLTSNSSNSATFEAGAGLDLKIAPFVSARADLRDFYSGSPDLVLNFTQRQNQLVGTLGLVLRF
jgi:hypothetical protein